ncbi:hypothetical protein FOMPIDRAFT_94766 [Fomitopsis schrenkii]|uniref:Uncharacterized protein n=1 Tax=Fomitopsis schrenkii TaxID=2126942 RepID=S8DJQ4_FOMSC|nr:hypothetical protein FOMPIDRAFT_94766 [Fomitopsis schrenkii]
MSFSRHTFGLAKISRSSAAILSLVALSVHLHPQLYIHDLPQISPGQNCEIRAQGSMRRTMVIWEVFVCMTAGKSFPLTKRLRVMSTIVISPPEDGRTLLTGGPSFMLTSPSMEHTRARTPTSKAAAAKPVVPPKWAKLMRTTTTPALIAASRGRAG